MFWSKYFIGYSLSKLPKTSAKIENKAKEAEQYWVCGYVLGFKKSGMDKSDQIPIANFLTNVRLKFLRQ